MAIGEEGLNMRFRLLAEMVDRGVHKNDLVRQLYDGSKTRRKTDNLVWRVLRELADLGYADHAGQWWRATRSGIRALDLARHERDEQLAAEANAVGAGMPMCITCGEPDHPGDCYREWS